MPTQPYKLSFTTGDLYYQEAIKAVELYQQSGDWAAVRRQILAANLFQSRTRASASRISRELLPRLELLTSEQLHLLVKGNRIEQNQILWLAVCKQYGFIKEFAMEVIREKAFRLDPSLNFSDFDAYFNAKSEWHEELAKLTVRTRKELRRVLFQMLREAEILSNMNQILPPLLSSRVIRSIQSEDANLCAVFPIGENDLLRQAAL